MRLRAGGENGGGKKDKTVMGVGANYVVMNEIMK